MKDQIRHQTNVVLNVAGPQGAITVPTTLTVQEVVERMGRCDDENDAGIWLPQPQAEHPEYGTLSLSPTWLTSQSFDKVLAVQDAIVIVVDDPRKVGQNRTASGIELPVN